MNKTNWIEIWGEFNEWYEKWAADEEVEPSWKEQKGKIQELVETYSN